MWHPEPLGSSSAIVSVLRSPHADEDKSPDERPGMEDGPSGSDSNPLSTAVPNLFSARQGPKRFGVRQLELSFSLRSQSSGTDQPLPRRFLESPSSCRHGAEQNLSTPRQQSVERSDATPASCESSDFGSDVWALGFEAGQGAVVMVPSSVDLLQSALTGTQRPLLFELPQLPDELGGSMGSFASPIVLDGSVGTGPSPRGAAVRIDVPSFDGIERVDIDERLVSNLTPALEQGTRRSPKLATPQESSMVCVGPFA